MTLPDNPTAQEIFDFVATHLFTQKKTARDETGRCLYRAPDGSRCAVGCLISDHDYSRRMEAKDIRHVLREFPLPGWFNPNYTLLNDLQCLHDNAVWTDTFLKHNLAHIANEHSLSPDILSTLSLKCAS